VLITTAAVNLGFSWWFAHRIHIEPVHESWRGTWHRSKRLLGLGLAFMWSGLLAAGVALAISSIIVRGLGLNANGIYQAAWGVSGVFAGFILSAMGTDFYPRLTAAAADHRRMNQLVNEQTEIGVLLALPGLLGTLVFAPFVMRVFYSEKFLPGAELLQWFAMGIFGQIISWPLGFVILAKGVGAWYAVSESCGNLLRLSLSMLFLHWLGLWGAALAVPVTYGLYTLGLLWICKRLTGFTWSPNSLRLISMSGALILAAFIARSRFPFYPSLAIGLLITLVGCVVCLRGLVIRLGRNHRICQWALALPLLRRLLAA
jgi:PST family polysaccharide transporter